VKPAASKEWLDRFLAGAQPTAAELKQLVADCPAEDQHLDYKSGKLLGKKDPAADVREYVAAFGNSDGGTLVVGYDLASRSFDGATPPGNSTLAEWATRSIAALAPFLSPPPRILTAAVDGREILLVATPRAPRLVPVHVKGELTYFIRIGDSNFAAPPFLMSDLVLGRRNHPTLKVSLFSAYAKPVDIDAVNVSGAELDLQVLIENTSLVFAEDVRCGLITWSTPYAKPRPNDGTLATESLKASLDVVVPAVYQPQQPQPKWTLIHVRLARTPVPGGTAQRLDLGPLDQAPNEELRKFTWPLFPNHLQHGPAAASPSSPFYEDTRRTRIQMRGAVELKAALYVLSRNAEPWWSQLTIRYDSHSLLTAGTKLVDLFTLGPVLTPRPVVSLDFYAPDGETI
jgi:hypothetical protein